MQRFKKGDEVIVVAGKDKGNRGSVLEVMLEDQNILVEGINLVKKHQKPNPNAGVPGGIVEKTMPLDISNVMHYNPITKKGDRIGFRTLDDGRKVRFYRSNQEIVTKDL
ncbi:MAG: 50S ribosomal protein L24 [Gammaproteobacteria bacterium]|nr:50S ribosomal protein L24 [Gammaproteobacteria bacterium]NNC96589.1 50S ribosomal protein L24 [Gammaproteobacteria bacterium]NNM14814.1 50S ribosomal protein L24 [Gammaproteobacteria bacterium]